MTSETSKKKTPKRLRKLEAICLLVANMKNIAQDLKENGFTNSEIKSFVENVFTQFFLLWGLELLNGCGKSQR